MKRSDMLKEIEDIIVFNRFSMNSDELAKAILNAMEKEYTILEKNYCKECNGPCMWKSL